MNLGGVFLNKLVFLIRSKKPVKLKSEGQKQREQLKQQYKKHYRKMREAKERFRRSQKTAAISAALKDMDKSELMDTFDALLFEVKNKITQTEARLDVVLESLESQETSSVRKNKAEELSSRAKAKDTLRQIKTEMGLLYSEIEQRAETLNVDKTIGRPDKTSVKSNGK